MDAVIRQAVQDELRRQSQRTECTERRPSGLLDRITKQPKGKKRKIRNKEYRIQMLWIHFDDKPKVFLPVHQRNGGEK